MGGLGFLVVSSNGPLWDVEQSWALLLGLLHLLSPALGLILS